MDEVHKKFDNFYILVQKILKRLDKGLPLYAAKILATGKPEKLLATIRAAITNGMTIMEIETYIINELKIQPSEIPTEYPILRRYLEYFYNVARII